MPKLAPTQPPLTRTQHAALHSVLAPLVERHALAWTEWLIFEALGEVGSFDKGWWLSFEEFQRFTSPPKDKAARTDDVARTTAERHTSKTRAKAAKWGFPYFARKCCNLAVGLLQPGCYLLGLDWYPGASKTRKRRLPGVRFLAREPTAAFQAAAKQKPDRMELVEWWLNQRYPTHKQLDADTPQQSRESPRAVEAAALAYTAGLRTRLRWIGLKGFAPAGQRKTLYRARRLVQLGRDGGEVAEEDSAPSRGAVTSGKQAGRLSEAVLLEQLRNPPKGLRMCILGEAGTGKSTLLEQLAWDLVGGELAAPEDVARVPFLASLKGWNPACPAALEDLIAAQAPGVPAQLVRDLCIAGRVVCLLDGLDEIRGSADDQRTALEWLEAQAARSDLQNVPLVVAGRPLAFDEMLLRQFRQRCWRLEDFTRENAGSYVSSYFADMPERALRLLEHMKTHARVRSLVARPLFLMLLCFQCRQRGRPLPAEEAELLERSLYEMLRRRGLAAERSLVLLGEVAWRCWGRGEHRVAESQVLKMLRGKQGSVRRTRLWEQTRERSGILVPDGVLWRFSEVTFLEYLAGRHAAAMSHRTIRRDFAARAWDPRWRAVINYMVDRLWVSDRPMARTLVCWLANEVQAGRDDFWRTLAIRCGVLMRSARSVRNRIERDLLHAATGRVLGSWMFFTKYKLRLSTGVEAARSLCALAALDEAPVLVALRDVLYGVSNTDDCMGLSFLRAPGGPLFPMRGTTSAGAEAAAGLLAELNTDAARAVLLEGVERGSTPQIRLASICGLIRSLRINRDCTVVGSAT